MGSEQHPDLRSQVEAIGGHLSEPEVCPCRGACHHKTASYPCSWYCEKVCGMIQERYEEVLRKPLLPGMSEQEHAAMSDRDLAIAVVDRMLGVLARELAAIRTERDREWGAILLRIIGGTPSAESALPCPDEASIQAWFATQVAAR